MENVYNFSMTELLAFALVFLRMVGFVVTMPIFGTAAVPSQLKVLFSLMLAFTIFPQIGWKQMSADIESITMITLAFKEIFVGLIFGFLARLFFMAVSMAGQMMSVSLGLASAQLFNPTMGESSTAFDQLFVTLASIFFLSINGHHILISGIFDSFHLVPLAKTGIGTEVFGHFGVLVQKIMAIAVKMSAPIMVAILFMNVAVAVIGRAVPQINILITSMPINILAGFMVTIVSMPLLLWEMRDLIDLTANELFQIVKAF